MRLQYYLLLFIVVLLPSHIVAQTTISKAPKSFSKDLVPSTADFPTKRLAVPNLRRVRAYDEQQPSNRFAVPIQSDIDFTNGEWKRLPNGDRIWRLNLSARNALGLAVFFDDFFLPEGATLHLYSKDKKQVLGAYTFLNNPKDGKFLIGFIQGEEAVLEYYEPQAVAEEPRLHIFRVDYAYHKDNYRNALRAGSAMELGFGTSQDCHENINCTMGQDFQLEKKAVCRILLVVAEGTGFCSGSLINNTAGDDTPFVLSAFHCQDGFTPLYDFWRFDFNFESTDCNNPEEEPLFESILGCERRAGRQQNDFLLLELKNPVPTSFDVYLLGWNRASTAPQDATMVHQPRGDIKKIAATDQNIRIFNGPIQWSNEITTPASHHFEVTWTQGNFEVGSSGAALLDENKRIVGQLHGGNGQCDNSQAWYGRLALSWEGGGESSNRLKDWLDPGNTGAMTLDGKVPQTTEGINIGGLLITEGGDPIANVLIQLVGASGYAATTFTDSQGAYLFSNVPDGDTYQINPFKRDEAGNGLSVLDLIQVRKHILNIEILGTPYQLLAADVNNSGSISTLDLILTQKVILGIDIEFSALSAWTFLPASANFINEDNPFQGITGGSFTFVVGQGAADINDFDIIGIKTGDVNNSVKLD